MPVPIGFLVNIAGACSFRTEGPRKGGDCGTAYVKWNEIKTIHFLSRIVENFTSGNFG